MYCANTTLIGYGKNSIKPNVLTNDGLSQTFPYNTSYYCNHRSVARVRSNIIVFSMTLLTTKYLLCTYSGLQN